VYASAVTLLTAIRTALMVNQAARALDGALELVRVLADGDAGVSTRLLSLADGLISDDPAVRSAELGDATSAALAAYRRARR
jgi:hypothetical protein